MEQLARSGSKKRDSISGCGAGSARSPFAAAPVTAITPDEYAVQWWSLYAYPNLTVKTVDGIGVCGPPTSHRHWDRSSSER